MARQILDALPKKMSWDSFRSWVHRAWERIGRVEDWVEIGTAGAPPFLNSWGNTGSGYDAAGFYRDPWNRVHLKGNITGGAAPIAAFTLPDNYRPIATLLIPICNDTTNGIVEIRVSGVVIPSISGASLDGVSFRMET